MSDGPQVFVTASHDVLFESDEKAQCDVCHQPVGEDADHEVSGRGLYVWSRGEERRYQEPPLCPGCAAAIGMTALQRWEIEEEEG